MENERLEPHHLLYPAAEQQSWKAPIYTIDKWHSAEESGSDAFLRFIVCTAISLHHISHYGIRGLIGWPCIISLYFTTPLYVKRSETGILGPDYGNQ